jgi:large subunit ribosomal protein L30
MALVRITQERSKIRCIEKHKRTLAALGLRRINHSVVHEDTPQIRGMVQLVRYLVRSEPVGPDATGGPMRPVRKAKRSSAVKKTGGKAKKAAAGKARRAREAMQSPREASRARRKRATRS